MREVLAFLNHGWVGTTVGFLGIISGLFLYWRSKIGGIVAIQSNDVSMIGRDDSVFPSELVIRYRNDVVPQITSSTVWIWNAGRKTIRGDAAVPSDPLRLEFAGEILNIATIRATRGAIGIECVVSAPSSIECRFDFLEPGDGGVFEILHSGDDQAPSCAGTLIGVRKGPQYWGRAWGAYSWNIPSRLFLLSLFGMGLGWVVHWLVNDTLPDGSVSKVELPIWLGNIFWLTMIGFSSYGLWKMRRRAPPALVIAGTSISEARKRGSKSRGA